MAEHQEAAKPKILIVEDEAIIALDLKSHLDQIGYTVLAQVNSAEKALELVEQGRPDLVLMDIILKGKMDGIDAADIIRSRWGIPVVFVTAYADRDRLERAKLVYPFGYLIKPFQDSDLKITVEMALYVSKVDRERRKADEELRESEERFKSQYHGSPIPTFTWQKKRENFELVDYNNAAAVVTKGEVIKFLGKKANEMYQDRQEILQDIHQCFTEKEVIRRELQSQHFMPGRTMITTYVYVPPDLVMVHTEDITERKQAEEMLRESEEKYRSLIENIQDGVYTLDSSGNFTFVNDVIVNRSGFPAEWFLSRSYLDVISKEDRERVQRHFNAVMEGKTEVYNLAYPCESGNLLQVEVCTAPLFDDAKVSGLIGISRDITERKQIEESLFYEKNLLTRITETSPVGIVKVDLDGRITFANKKAEEVLGLSKDGITNRTYNAPTWKITDFAGQLIADEELPFRRVMDTGLSVYGVHHAIEWPDRKRVLLSINASPLYSKSGKLDGMVATLEDITERKRAEDALQERDIQFKKLSSWVPGMIYQFTKRPDGSYCVPFTTETIKDIFGCSPQDVREDFSSIAKVILLEDLDKVIASIEYSAKYLTVWTCEYRVQIPGQSIRWMQGKSTPEKLADGSITWYGFNTDITERKIAEEELRKAHREWENIFQAIGHPALILSPQHDIMAVNRAAIYATGMTEQALVEKKCYEVFHGKNNVSPPSGCPLEKLVNSGQLETNEMPVETLDGVFLVSCTPVFNSQGHLEKIIHIAMDITDRKQIEEMLHASLQEKEILLREVHHRVKNNMQVMAGLLNLQARLSGYPELTEMLNEGQRRIRAMALIHEELYDSKDFARIDLAGYVRTLSRELFQAYKINPGEIELIIQTDGAVYVDINKGIPCGLIMNELITNALKHAFSEDELGKLQIIIHETKNTEIKIVVRDNGLGLPEDVDIHQPRSVGLHLVNGLVTNQLDGQIEVIRGTGTEFRITFPLLFAGKGR